MPSNSFADLPVTAANHFRLHLYGSVFEVLRRASEALGSQQSALEHYPFLASYAGELARVGPATLGLDEALERWERMLIDWESGTRGHLPLRALVLAGCVEEDARLGFVFDDVQGTTSHWPVAAVLDSWHAHATAMASGLVVERLRRMGVIEVAESDLPRASRAARVPGVVWEAIRCDTANQLAPWATYSAPDDETCIQRFVTTAEVAVQASAVPGLLILLCYKRSAQQNGERGSWARRKRATSIRRVAMEVGLCRSARARRTARFEVERKLRGA